MAYFILMIVKKRAGLESLLPVQKAVLVPMKLRGEVSAILQHIYKSPKTSHNINQTIKSSNHPKS